VVELLSILCDVFSKEPPVISRQEIANVPLQSIRPPPLPPLPRAQSRESHQNVTTAQSTPPPPPPPKQQIEADADGVPKSSPPGRYDAPPPLPDAASSASSQPLHNIHGGLRSPSSQLMPKRNTGLSQSMTPPHFQQQQNFMQPLPSQNGNNIRLSAPPAGVSPQCAPPLMSPSQAPVLYRQSSISQSRPSSQYVRREQHAFQATTSHFPPSLHQQGNITSHYQQQPSHPRPAPQPKPPPLDLLDSPFDINLPVASSASIPAPPIPPNPEKDALLSALSQSITQTLHHDMSQNAASLPLLRSQNEALNNSLRTLESELAHLKALQGTLTGNVSILQSSLREADKCISSAHARAQRGEIPKIDDMLTAPTVVGKQLYDVVCDERGIDAALWALQAALTRGRITTDVWARKTRELSREGFKRKVLGWKIASGMGLEG